MCDVCHSSPQPCTLPFFCDAVSSLAADAYMAPELVFDNPYGTSADMFSFGIVLWETIYRQKVREALGGGDVRAPRQGGGGHGMERDRFSFGLLEHARYQNMMWLG